MIKYGDDFILTRKEINALFSVQRKLATVAIINDIEQHANQTDRLTIMNYTQDLIRHLTAKTEKQEQKVPDSQICQTPSLNTKK